MITLIIDESFIFEQMSPFICMSEYINGSVNVVKDASSIPYAYRNDLHYVHGIFYASMMPENRVFEGKHLAKLIG